MMARKERVAYSGDWRHHVFSGVDTSVNICMCLSSGVSLGVVSSSSWLHTGGSDNAGTKHDKFSGAVLL